MHWMLPRGHAARCFVRLNRERAAPQVLVSDDGTVPTNEIRKLLSFKMITSQKTLDKANTHCPSTLLLSPSTSVLIRF